MSTAINLEFNKNEDAMKMAISDLKKINEQVKLGGGKKSIERHKEKGKTNRSRAIRVVVR
jgi:3-methylcrotonyl-CoA carboxylase beta subunit